MANASGVDQAQQNLSLLSAKNGAETGANLTKAGKSMTPDQLQAAKANFAKSETAKATLDTAVEQRENALKAEGASDAKLQALNEKVKTANDAYVDALNLDQSQLEAKLGAKRLELTQLERNPAVNKAEIKAAKAEIADLEQQRTWGRAYVTDQKMKGGYTDSLADDIEAAEQSFGKATKMLEHDAAYKSAEARAHGWQTASDLLRQTGQLLEGITQSVTGMQQAAATEYEAAAKTAEDARAESDDLATSAQQLVQSVLDLLQAILAAENQSINQIVA